MAEGTKWHTMGAGEALEALKTSGRGLSESEAAKRLGEYGYNELAKMKRVTLPGLLLSQFTSFLVLILAAATTVSLLIGEVINAAVILAIVVINGLLGFFQDYRSEKALEALKKMAAPRVRVVRDRGEKEIPARELVPGDIVLLATGTRVPADCRIIESVNLRTDEAPLTGESVPSQKTTDALGDVPLADRENMAFAGTTVVYGRGGAVVVSTGMGTEVGKIAALVQVPEERTPLQKKLDAMGRRIGALVIAISAAVFLVGFLRGLEATDIFLTSVSLAVAAVPEGLPAVVTVTLAIGLQRMARRNALIRRLAAVESLGSTTVICSDKTGTLTRGEMVVRRIFADGRVIDVTGEGYSAKGEFLYRGRRVTDNPALSLLLRIGRMCNDARLRDGSMFGDPTEGALLVAAEKFGVAESYPRIGEIPFSSERKCMTTMHSAPEGTVAYTKGAPEVVLGLCSRIYRNGRAAKLTAGERRKLLLLNQKMAGEGFRTLAFAYNEKTVEKNMVFAGIAAMVDPPREEARRAVFLCRQAGIRAVMITGDHKSTAIYVAKELGIFGKNSEALTGEELDALSDVELAKRVERIAVYARVSPSHKVRIVDALKSKGHIVAMTGDGVNDAPALKKADIGVAMGITGTDVTKETSDMVLTDDNFASIVAAVEEGRTIYDNIKKFVRYLLFCNTAEVLVVFGAVLLFLPLPLTAAQILWMNLVTDGLPAVALSVDPPEQVMKRRPRDPNEGVLSRKALLAMAIAGAAIASGVLAVFMTSPAEKAQTAAFTALVFVQLCIVFGMRSKQTFHYGGNKWLVLGVASSSVLQLAAVYWGGFQALFGTVPLGIGDWIKIAVLCAAVLLSMELAKKLKPSI